MTGHLAQIVIGAGVLYQRCDISPFVKESQPHRQQQQHQRHMLRQSPFGYWIRVLMSRRGLGEEFPHVSGNLIRGIPDNDVPQYAAAINDKIRW